MNSTLVGSTSLRWPEPENDRTPRRTGARWYDNTAILDDRSLGVICEAKRRASRGLPKDTATLSELFADEMWATHANAAAYTKVSYLKAIDERIFDYQRVERTDTHARRVGDTVLVTGRARMDVAANGRQVLLNARYSMVWVRKDEFDHFGLGPTGAVRHATHSLCHVIAQLDR